MEAVPRPLLEPRGQQDGTLHRPRGGPSRPGPLCWLLTARGPMWKINSAAMPRSRRAHTDRGMEGAPPPFNLRKSGQVMRPSDAKSPGTSSASRTRPPSAEGWGARLYGPGLHMPSPRGHRTGERGGPGPRAQGAAQKLAGAATERRWVQGPEKVGVLEDSWASVGVRSHSRAMQATEVRWGGLGAIWEEQKLGRRPDVTRDRRQVQDDHGAFGQNSQVK